MIGIDLQNRKPIYEQIVERFETLIVSGVLEPDSQMPSVRSLATELSINPNTIQKAYSMLEQRGYIYPVRGRGNFVSGNGALMKQKKQESVFRSLEELVQKGKELDITCEEFLNKVRNCYEKNGDSRDILESDKRNSDSRDTPESDEGNADRSDERMQVSSFDDKLSYVQGGAGV